MKSSLQIIKLASCPVTVAYRQQDDGLWLANALQFDIVGTGDTQAEALAQLKELVNDYLLFVLGHEGRKAIFNPADREEWEVPLKEEFALWAVLSKPIVTTPALRLDEIPTLHENIIEFEMAPSGY